VQVSLTFEEGRVIRDLAELRKLTMSDLVREVLHLLPIEQALEERCSPTPVRELQVVKPPSPAPTRRRSSVRPQHVRGGQRGQQRGGH
jgi:hypothetical protein